MSRDPLLRLPGNRRPTRTATRFVREGYSHLRRTLRELEQQGCLEAHERPDKRTGYWPTEKGLQTQD